MNPVNSKIAVLGWGSLVWRPEGDASRCQKPLEIVGGWKEEGPTLPIEFSRVSGDQSLTLVIDAKNGSPCRTLYAQSKFPKLDDAIGNLMDRECTTPKNIHSVRREQACRNSIQQTVHEWLINSNFEAAIWTGLASNFEEKKGCPFSVANAIQHLESLGTNSKQSAYTYIIRAPRSVITPLRIEFLWPEAAAVHEAGHYVVAICLNRPVARLSRVKVDDRPGEQPSIGCRYPQPDFEDVGAILCDMAGAQAQVLYAPATIAPEHFQLFQATVLHPADKVMFYAINRWKEDFEPIWTWMQISECPFGNGVTVTVREVLQKCACHLRSFMQRHSVRLAIDVAASTLLRRPVLVKEDLDDLRNCVSSILTPNDKEQIYPPGLEPAD